MIHCCNLIQDTRVCNVIQVCRPAAVNRGCCSCSCSVHRCACATRAGSVCGGRCREETGRETLGLGPELLHTPQPLLYHPVPPCTMELPSCATLPSSTTFEQLLCVFYTGHFSGTLVFETVACFIATCMPGPPSVFVCTWPSALALYIRSVQTYSHCKYTNQE